MSQPDTGEQALEITDMLIRSGAIDIVVIDSVAALVPRAEIEGEMGDSHVGLQARLMSQALRKITGALSNTNTTAIFINQLREKIGVMFGSPETTTGGKALKFYASVRLDVRRIEALKDGTEAVGNRTRVKVVKNKVASPFKQAEFDIIYGQGISREGSLIDVGVEQSIIRKAGAWYTYDGDQLGQGKENARKFLKENPDVAAEIEKKILEKLGVGAALVPDAWPATASSRSTSRSSRCQDDERARGGVGMPPRPGRDPRNRGRPASAAARRSRRSREIRTSGPARSACSSCRFALARAPNSPLRCGSVRSTTTSRRPVLDRYDEVGLIDDAAFAKAWVSSRHHGRGLARRALASELRQRGVDPRWSIEALDEVDGETEAATARALVDRKLRSMSRRAAGGRVPPAGRRCWPARAIRRAWRSARSKTRWPRTARRIAPTSPRELDVDTLVDVMRRVRPERSSDMRRCTAQSIAVSARNECHADADRRAVRLIPDHEFLTEPPSAT